MSETAVTIGIVAAFLIIFPLFWMGIVLLVAKVSGWASLASQYPESGPVRGEVFHLRSGRIRMFSSYSGCLTVTVSADGFHLKPIFVFAAGHDPIFVPWNAVETVRSSGSSFFASAHFTIRNKDGGTSKEVTLYGQSLIDSLKRHYRSG